ncbi:MAG: J domain-containing protein [Alkalilacustris sp.]
MTARPPFEFDIRVSTDKKRRTRGRRGMSGAVETSTRQCEHPGCDRPGQYRAPKSPDSLDDYWWFCREHVREYNLKWNFFAGQTDEEMFENMEHDRVWGRATEPFSERDPRRADQRAWARLGVADPMEILGDKATRNPGRTATNAHTRRLPPTERRALEILDARDSWSRAEIRKQYKSLVKDLHPDMNGGNRADEDRLQEVVWAWDQLRESRNFRD